MIRRTSHGFLFRDCGSPARGPPTPLPRRPSPTPALSAHPPPLLPHLGADAADGGGPPPPPPPPPPPLLMPRPLALPPERSPRPGSQPPRPSAAGLRRTEPRPAMADETRQGTDPPVVELSSSLEHSVQTRIFKIIVIGDSNVGKTCLTFRFTGGAFPEKTEATIGVDFREKAVEIEGERIKVQVWDTAGQERFRKSMVEHYYRNVHAVVFVYDVTNMASFQNLKTWIQECNGHRVSPAVPRVLVGNKCDLVSQIQVPSNTALKFADAHNMLLFETSAKDPKESQNVDSIFMCLACRLKAQKSLLYRDVQREDGRLKLSQEPNPKSTCPC
ncbi:ras-related protein Rab-33A [Scleropages formosus]|uniref:small monomeric GTPase n=2 Tax=Scleropages formosus TaxID=113540 RepID=A0A8C9TNL5_SCLFO|nr:ras-related protein Rab-33A-like [Scleropages formosus]